MYIIYALLDPRDSRVHYVGMTDNVYKRFLAHIQCSGSNFAKNAWMLSLREANVMVQMQELERVEDVGRARVRESYWIHHYIALDHPLTNIQRAALRLVCKVLVRSSSARSPKAAIAAIENELQLPTIVQVSEEQVETEMVIVEPNRPTDEAQSTQNDAKYRMTEKQAEMFCLLYPEIIENKDEALRRVGVNTAYRAHANELILQHQLKKRKEAK